MDIRSALKHQYHASIRTIRLAVEKCPQAMWNDPADGAAAFWRVACHALYYANWYMQQDRSGRMAWPGYRQDIQRLEGQPCEPMGREEVLAFCQWCDAEVDAGIDRLDLDAPQCGFPWYKMPTLEHQIVNIRHIQHHAGALATRLRRQCGIEVDWVGG